MGKKPQENPQLDMTPMIDVVFELIIFFVVTLVEAQKKDESIEVLTPDELPPTHMEIDIGLHQSGPKKGKPRISMGDIEITPAEISRRVRERVKKYKDFPVMVRADFAVPHKAVAQVMNACTEAGVWKISFVAVQEDKTHARKRLRKIRK